MKIILSRQSESLQTRVDADPGREPGLQSRCRTPQEGCWSGAGYWTEILTDINNRSDDKAGDLDQDRDKHSSSPQKEKIVLMRLKSQLQITYDICHHLELGIAGTWFARK